MKVGGILETAMPVADPAASAAFYRRFFGYETLLGTDRLIALTVARRDVLLLSRKVATQEPAVVPGGVILPHGVSAARSRGVAIESVVTWPGGARSVYFRDPDRHLVEIIGPGFWAVY